MKELDKAEQLRRYETAVEEARQLYIGAADKKAPNAPRLFNEYNQLLHAYRLKLRAYAKETGSDG